MALIVEKNKLFFFNKNFITNIDSQFAKSE